MKIETIDGQKFWIKWLVYSSEIFLRHSIFIGTYWQFTATMLLLILLNQARAGFLKLLSSAKSVGLCACVCVHPPGYKLHSRDIEPVQPAEQVWLRLETT